ncbi:MAG: endonuclease domain-containing protein [Patescibacteria group bacterium]|jgi:very-short-patch-repair endonuclease
MRNKCLVNKVKQKNTRQFLRVNQTETEKILWEHLRDNNLGIKFSRQYGIENYIADFCCRTKRLIIEIDGEIHNETVSKEGDAERTERLEGFGYKVVRFTNKEIFEDLNLVLEKIKKLIK